MLARVTLQSDIHMEEGQNTNNNITSRYAIKGSGPEHREGRVDIVVRHFNPFAETSCT